jgi:hypothetical protein
MRSFAINLRHMLGRARRVTVRLALTGRWPLSLGIAATLFATPVGPMVQAYPSEPSPPNARLQFVIRSVHIRDDRDLFGAGEMRFTAYTRGDGTELSKCGEEPLARWDYGFDADSGDTRDLDHMVPQEGDRAEGGATVEAGVPVYLDQHYHFYAYMKDEDEFTYDQMGYVAVPLPAEPSSGGATASAGPGPVGVPSPEPKPTGAQTNPAGAQADLTVRAIKVNGQVPDGKDDCKAGKNTVTVMVKNAGQDDVGTFRVRLRIDGTARDATANDLAAGQEREVRFANVELAPGGHTLTAAAGPVRAVSEYAARDDGLTVTARCQG